MRPHRLQKPNSFFHVITRGNNRQAVFKTDEEKLKYIQIMVKIFSALQIRIYGYCIMDTHIHLIVEDVKGGELSKAMQRLNGSYAKYWNRKYNKKGHVFENRYTAILVENDIYLLILSIYIHNNPVYAGIVFNSWEYRWSSVHTYLGGGSEVIVSTDMVLQLAGGRDYYLKLLKDKSKIDTILEDMDNFTNKVRGLQYLGSNQFSDVIEPLVNRRSDRRNKNLRPVCTFNLYELAEKVSQATGIDIKKICGSSRVRETSKARRLLCAVARHEGIAAIEIARFINRTVSAVLHLSEKVNIKDIKHILEDTNETY